MVGEPRCKRCGAPFSRWRGETLCRDCRKDVILRDLPGDEVVRESLRHFRRPVTVEEGEAVVEAGRLRLRFEILEDPVPVGFSLRASTWVRFLQAEVK